MKPEGFVVLKISGEAFSGKDTVFSPEGFSFIKYEIESLLENSILPLIVLGGGNIYRGRSGLFSREAGDYMGMFATIINSMGLRDYLNENGIRANGYSSIEIARGIDFIDYDKVKKDMRLGVIPIFGGGTGNPYFSTDSLASLRAAEFSIPLILKGSTVDGIYNRDPKKYSDAEFIPQITFENAMKSDLGVVFDHAAFHLARMNHTELVVYDFFKKGNTLKAFKKETGTHVKWEE